MNRFNLGDLVFAAIDLHNDPLEETGEGGVPGVAANELLAAAGTRGVVVNVGHAEADPKQDIYLVRFETGPDGNLAEPIGCLAEEIGYGAMQAA
ncbi:MAG: nitrogen fixation protein NifZ [Hydrogenophilales bacterium 28-61-23]|nr:MAG: nitrogen fixation protein NifZ [Hydrogenophilales bacterium 28-61-23]